MSSYTRIRSRSDFIDYCLRRLGHPVIEINVDDEQIEDRINDALQLFMDYVTEGSVRVYAGLTITQDIIDRGFIDFDLDSTIVQSVADDILSVVRVLPINDSTSSVNFFDVKYQMRLNDLWDLQTGIGDLAYYEQLQQYLTTIDMKLTGHPQIQFNRNGNTLNIFGDIAGSKGDLQVGDKIMIEMWVASNANANGKIYDNMFLKEYATALIKEQWGQNLIKFDGMTLPGGVQLNGRQILEDAKTEIETIRQRIYNEYDTPPDFFVG
jgi:hypothetical protein